MLSLYKICSEMIAAAVITQGPIATKTPLIRGMRTIKKEILKLVETFVSKSEDNQQQVMGNLIPPLFDAILGDYSKSIDLARDAEVLSVTASIITKLRELLLDLIPPILSAVFEPSTSAASRPCSNFLLPSLSSLLTRLCGRSSTPCAILGRRGCKFAWTFW